MSFLYILKKNLHWYRFRGILRILQSLSRQWIDKDMLQCNKKTRHKNHIINKKTDRLKQQVWDTHCLIFMSTVHQLSLQLEESNRHHCLITWTTSMDCVMCTAYAKTWCKIQIMRKKKMSKQGRKEQHLPADCHRA